MSFDYDFIIRTSPTDFLPPFDGCDVLEIRIRNTDEPPPQPLKIKSFLVKRRVLLTVAHDVKSEDIIFHILFSVGVHPSPDTMLPLMLRISEIAHNMFDKKPTCNLLDLLPHNVLGKMAHQLENRPKSGLVRKYGFEEDSATSEMMSKRRRCC